VLGVLFNQKLRLIIIVADHAVRFSLKDLEKSYEKTEDDIKAVQSVGQIIGEVMKQLDDDRCT
jgi:ATP-dependent 26S proteasome regulatory subunit